MKRFLSFSLFVCLIGSTTSALASALSKPVVIGPKAIGMGGAFVAIADDPTAIFHNPAGLTKTEGYRFHFGMDGLITNLDYSPPTGAVESAKKEFLPVPQFGFATNRFQKIYLGFGLFFPHGNGGKFSAPSSVASNPDEGRIYSMELDPAIAWKVSDEFSLGATLRVVRISSSLKNQILPAGTGFITLQDLNLSGWAVGASAGFLYEPCQYFSFGANYRTQVKATLTGDATFTTYGTLGASLDQTLPTLITVGFASRPIDQLTLGIGYGFERNSEVQNLTAEVDTLGTITLPQNWSDSHTIHFGAEYKFTPEFAVRGGYAKDLNDSIPDTAMNRVVGDIAAHETSAGLAYTWGRYTFSGTWNARFGSRDIPVAGTANIAPGGYDAIVQSISVALGLQI